MYLYYIAGCQKMVSDGPHKPTRKPHEFESRTRY